MWFSFDWSYFYFLYDCSWKWAQTISKCKNTCFLFLLCHLSTLIILKEIQCFGVVSFWLFLSLHSFKQEVVKSTLNASWFCFTWITLIGLVLQKFNNYLWLNFILMMATDSGTSSQISVQKDELHIIWVKKIVLP